MKKQITIYALLVALAYIIISCNKDDESELIMIDELTDSNYTKDGYFDGIMYYKKMPIVENKVEITKCEQSAKVVEIPSYKIINGKKYAITSIGKQAFFNCTNLTSITIPNSVTGIGGYAFLYCTSLQKVIVPDIAAWCGVTIGGSDANPLSIAMHLYSDENTEIKDLVIPNSVTSIGPSTFYNCTGLKSVAIGNSVTSIGVRAFRGCSRLTSITIGNSVTRIRNHAFRECAGLTSVEIPNSVTRIDESAFHDCSRLKSITIGNSVKTIDDHAFGGCTNLHSVNSKIMNPEKVYFGTTPFSLIDTLFVPKGKVKSYLSSNWKQYFRIITDGDNTKEII